MMEQSPPFSRHQLFGFALLFILALLLIWGGITGRTADMLAALLAPAYLEEGP